MIVKVCVGSSCHLKGSYDVIEEMKRLLKQYGIEDRIELQASFCIGACADGVIVKAETCSHAENAVLIHHVDKDNVKEKFLNEILPILDN